MIRLLLFSVLVTTAVVRGQSFEFVRVEQSLPEPGGWEFEMVSAHAVGVTRVASALSIGIKNEWSLGTEGIGMVGATLCQDAMRQGGESDLAYAGALAVGAKVRIRQEDEMLPGIALYADLGFSRDEAAAVLRVILDKRWDRHAVAFNLYGARSLSWQGDWREDYPLDLVAGYQFALTPRLHVGIEAVQSNHYTTEGWSHSAFGVGPTLAWMGDGWFLLFHALPRMEHRYHPERCGPEAMDESVDARVQVAVGL